MWKIGLLELIENKKLKILSTKILLTKMNYCNYNVMINGKKFYDQAIDSDIKRNKETRKLTAGQEELYYRMFVRL